MKTKFGAIIVAGSGKIGGHVASKNRGGSYLRTKVTPANARTTFQNAVRARFTELSQAWRSLTDDQHIAWNAAVTSFARTDIFGDLRNPSGLNLFQRLNNNLLNIGEAVISDPPTPVSVDPCVLSSATNVIGTPSMTIDFAPAISANIKVKLFATAPQSAGKSFVKNQYRQISVLSTSSPTPLTILAPYLVKFGTQGEIGQKIFFKIQPVDLATGIVGGTSSVYVIASE